MPLHLDERPVADLTTHCLYQRLKGEADRVFTEVRDNLASDDSPPNNHQDNALDPTFLLLAKLEKFIGRMNHACIKLQGQSEQFLKEMKAAQIPLLDSLAMANETTDKVAIFAAWDNLTQKKQQDEETLATTDAALKGCIELKDEAIKLKDALDIKQEQLERYRKESDIANLEQFAKCREEKQQQVAQAARDKAAAHLQAREAEYAKFAKHLENEADRFNHLRTDAAQLLQEQKQRINHFSLFSWLMQILMSDEKTTRKVLALTVAINSVYNSANETSLVTTLDNLLQSDDVVGGRSKLSACRPPFFFSESKVKEELQQFIANHRLQKRTV